MRWVIIGCSGQLGAEFLDLMKGTSVGLPREKADLTRPIDIENYLLAEYPIGIINCAAFNYVDKAEDYPCEAFATNAWGVRDLASICFKHNIKLIHFSTDHVFSGLKFKPWVENDPTFPANSYGFSKLSGEMWARKLNPQTLVVRTCGLYGNKGKGGKGTNFVATIQKLAKTKNFLSVVNDQTCNPSSARDVAKATIQLMEQFVPGVYHLANTGSCSWYTFAKAILELSGQSVHVQPISSSQLGSRAKRPQYSVLGSLWQGTQHYPFMRPWQESLAEYLKIGSNAG